MTHSQTGIVLCFLAQQEVHLVYRLLQKEFHLKRYGLMNPCHLRVNPKGHPYTCSPHHSNLSVALTQ
jgi:hypothetical protein